VQGETPEGGWNPQDPQNQDQKEVLETQSAQASAIGGKKAI
jgi:hypothetical protein